MTKENILSAIFNQTNTDGRYIYLGGSKLRGKRYCVRVYLACLDETFVWIYDKTESGYEYVASPSLKNFLDNLDHFINLKK
jgi:hypothetical protein